MDINQKVIEGWRFLDLKPYEVMALTPKEFDLLMKAQNEKLYDELEMASIKAVMMRAAYHSDKKNLKAQDLFKRPTDEVTEENKVEQMKQTMEQQQEWLNQFNFGKGGDHG